MWNKLFVEKNWRKTKGLFPVQKSHNTRVLWVVVETLDLTTSTIKIYERTENKSQQQD